MKVSELVEILEDLRKEHGDVDVLWESISHRFPPEPVIRECLDGKCIVLN